MPTVHSFKGFRIAHLHPVLMRSHLILCRLLHRAMVFRPCLQILSTLPSSLRVLPSFSRNRRFLLRTYWYVAFLTVVRFPWSWTSSDPAFNLVPGPADSPSSTSGSAWFFLEDLSSFLGYILPCNPDEPSARRSRFFPEFNNFHCLVALVPALVPLSSSIDLLGNSLRLFDSQGHGLPFLFSPLVLFSFSAL